MKRKSSNCTSKATPQSLYQTEKAKRQRTLPHDELMAEAKREYQRLMDESQAARKGGRPKKQK